MEEVVAAVSNKQAPVPVWGWGLEKENYEPEAGLGRLAIEKRMKRGEEEEVVLCTSRQIDAEEVKDDQDAVEQYRRDAF